MSSEFLRRFHRDPVVLFNQSDREAIIDRANQRGFFVTVGKRLYRATITGTRLYYPQVIIPSTGQVFEITWQKAHLLSQNCITLKFL